MALNNNFPFVPNKAELSIGYLRLMMKALNRALSGKLNCTGTVTLRASQTTTTVTDNNCLANSVVLMQPTTAHAAGLGADGYVVAADGSFVINHSSNASTDRTFNYAILG